MSWDADLIEDSGYVRGSWNYTHNTNRMAAAALGSVHPDPWFRRLDGLDGIESAWLLNRIIGPMQADPQRFRRMDPENGWGSYDSFIRVLIEMSRAIPTVEPCVWRVTG